MSGVNVLIITGEAREASTNRALKGEREFFEWLKEKYILRRNNTIYERAERLNG